MMISCNSRRGINKAHNWHIYLFQVWVLHKNSIFMISWFTFSFFLKDGLQVMRLRLGQPILPQLVAVDDFQLELQVCQCQLQLRVYFFQHWKYKKNNILWKLVERSQSRGGVNIFHAYFLILEGLVRFWSFDISGHLISSTMPTGIFIRLFLSEGLNPLSAWTSATG